MNAAEAGKLLALMALYDNRKAGTADVVAWLKVIGDLQYADCESATLAHYQETRERIMPADAALSHCAAHGPRQLIGYDATETLVYRRPELYVLVKKYPKYVCANEPACGVASPERPTSLVEGDRYDTSVAATIVEAKWFHHLPIYRQQWLGARSLNALEHREPGRFRAHTADRSDDPPGSAGHRRGAGRDELSHALAQGNTAGRRSEEPAVGGKGGRSAGRGPRQSPGQDVGLLGTARGTLQHLRLPRLAASRWTG